MSAPPAIVVLTRSAAPLAERLRSVLDAAEVHARPGATDGADVSVDGVADHLRTLFAAGRPIVGLCAAGILIRALAPLLSDKRREPPVLAVAEDGSAVVPLLGGHHGAHDLAHRLGAALDVRPAITTAGDLRFGVALDEPPPGWRLANPEDAKPFTAALLEGATVRLDGTAAWLRESDLPLAADGRLTLLATDRTAPGAPDRLVYHPAALAVGVGAARDADPTSAVELAVGTLQAHGLAEAAVAGVFSIDLKADEPAVHAVAGRLGVPARFFDAATLEAETPRLANPSETVFREVGCHGVAEAAALAAAGPGGTLVAQKAKTAEATCAVARAPAPIDATRTGRPQGRLAIVGLGPGTPAWRTPEAASVLAAADDVVGYGPYIDLAGPLRPGTRRHDYRLGEEEARARAALDLAAQGRTIALVSSGDPGIYAMATLVFELLDRTARADWQRVAVTVVPGLSAFQAAAARIGAPMGHDFAVISLSDLLTPWAAILRRLEAAAEADFVVALYNPVSTRRRWQLAEAKAVLLRHRTADTPTVVARGLGRDGEAVMALRLADLTVERVDMLSLVLVGASTTRLLPRPRGGAWVYTPRGYAGKPASALGDDT